MRFAAHFKPVRYERVDKPDILATRQIGCKFEHPPGEKEALYAPFFDQTKDFGMMCFDQYIIKAGIMRGTPVNAVPVAIGGIHAKRIDTVQARKIESAQAWPVPDDNKQPVCSGVPWLTVFIR